MCMYWRQFSPLSPLRWVGAKELRLVWMNALVGFQGKVQEEELDSCREEPASGGRQRDEGAGRNQSGFSLREFWTAKKRGGEAQPLQALYVRPLSSQSWLSIAGASWPSL